MNPTKKRTLLPLAVLSLVLLIGVIGCSKSGKVTGTVKYDGKTVPVGTITFHPEKGKAVSVDFKGGEFTADKIPPGPVIVTVSTANQRAQYKAAESAQKGGAGGLPMGGGTAKDMKGKLKDQGEMKEMEKMKEEGAKTWEELKDMIDVPEQYGDKDKSNLKYDIKPGSQDLDIELPKVEAPKQKPK